MNRFIYLFICIFYFFGAIYCVQKTALGTQGSGYLWGSPNNWSPNSVPTINDWVLIPQSIMVADPYIINVVNMTIGTATTAGGLETSSKVTIGGLQIINPGSYVALIPPSTGTAVLTAYTVNGQYIHFKGNLLVVAGAKYAFNGNAITYIYPNAAVQNNGTLISYSAIITDGQSTFINNYYMDFDNINLLTGSHYFNPGSVTHFSTLTADNEGYFQFQSANGFLYGDAFFQKTCILGFLEGSNFTIINEKYILGNDTSATVFKFMDSAALLSFGSNIEINGGFISVINSAKIQLDSSKLVTNSTTVLRDNSTLQLTKNSEFSTIGNIVADGSALIHVEESKILIKDNTLALLNYNTGEFFASELYISVNNSENSILGIFNSSKLYFFEGSKFYLDGFFLAYDNSLLYLNASEFTVDNIFFLSDNANCSVVQQSKMDILNIFAVRGSSKFSIQDSTLKVTSNITFYEFPTFQFKNSNISVNGLFNYKVENSNLNTIENSLIDVNGFFSNSGLISISGSTLSVFSNFSNIGNLQLKDNSKILVEQGRFYSDNLFDGSDSSIQLNNGSLEVESLSVFNCLNCNITILNGILKQGINASLNFNNTIFNNKNGEVEASGIIKLESGGISNNGKFTLKSDIILSGTNTTGVSVENTGQFLISGDLPSNINVPFNNKGQVEIQQKTTFSLYVQGVGQLTLANDISSNETISINGGSIVGKGVIESDVSNNGGTLGTEKDVDQITITGDYTQSTNSNIRITIDGENNSKVIINGNATLDGTIYIRVNKDLVEKSTENVSISVVEHATSSGTTFKKIVIVTYDEETKKDTVVTNNCKIKTTHNDKSFSLLLSPNESDECNGTADDNESNSSKKKISKGAIIGIVVGVVGAAIIVCGIYFIKHKTDFQILNKKLKSIPMNSTGSTKA